MLPEGYIEIDEAARRLELTSSGVRRILREYHEPEEGKEPNDRGLRGMVFGGARRRFWIVQESSLQNYTRGAGGKPRKEAS